MNGMKSRFDECEIPWNGYPTIMNIYHRNLTARVDTFFLHQVACLSAEAVGRNIEAFSYALVAMRGFELVRGHPDVEPLKVPFLQLSSDLASDLGQVRPVRQISSCLCCWVGGGIDGSQRCRNILGTCEMSTFGA